MLQRIFPILCCVLRLLKLLGNGTSVTKQSQRPRRQDNVGLERLRIRWRPVLRGTKIWLWSSHKSRRHAVTISADTPKTITVASDLKFYYKTGAVNHHFCTIVHDMINFASCIARKRIEFLLKPVGGLYICLKVLIFEHWSQT